MLTPDQLADLARATDEAARDAYANGICVEIAPAIYLLFTPDGCLSLDGITAPTVLTPAKTRALLYGLRMLDATSDGAALVPPCAPWEADTDTWKRGGAL